MAGTLQDLFGRAIRLTLVAVKIGAGDAFVITAFFTDAIKKGERLWEK